MSEHSGLGHTRGGCSFCAIVGGSEPASIVHRDPDVVAFMSIRPIRRGQFMVIPASHVDHFSDLDDDLCAKVTRVAQRLGRRLRSLFSCQRVGWVVHGYGVPHAHLIVVPQNDPFDIASARHVGLEDGQIVFSEKTHCPLVPRAELDLHARVISRGAW